MLAVVTDDLEVDDDDDDDDDEDDDPRKVAKPNLRPQLPESLGPLTAFQPAFGSMSTTSSLVSVPSLSFLRRRRLCDSGVMVTDLSGRFEASDGLTELEGDLVIVTLVPEPSSLLRSAERPSVVDGCSSFAVAAIKAGSLALLVTCVAAASAAVVITASGSEAVAAAAGESLHSCAWSIGCCSSASGDRS